MTSGQLDALEKRLATSDPVAFDAIRELRLELRVMTRAYNDLYKERYGDKPTPIFGHVRSV